MFDVSTFSPRHGLGSLLNTKPISDMQEVMKRLDKLNGRA